VALTTAQKRQVLRLPTVDATVDSLDQKALLGVFDVETTAPTLSTAIQRQILRLPTVDGAVDETDAFALLQTPESGGGGNELISFELGWTIDPTYQLSEVENSVSGDVAVTMEQFQLLVQGFATKPVAEFGPGKPGRSSKKRRPRIRLRDKSNC